MASILDVVNGISTVMSQCAFDGALDEDGKPFKIGLKREVDNVITDSRVIDGFTVSFHGPILRLKYVSEVGLKEVHEKNKFETGIESTISDIAGFIKKEYKKITGNSLALTKEGDSKILVQNISRLRTWVQAHCDYKIGGLSDVPEVLENKQPTEPLEAFRKFLAADDSKRSVGTGYLGNATYPDSKKPENVTGKQDAEPRE